MMYETKNTLDNKNVMMLMVLCLAISLLLMKYNESNKRMLQVPLIKALSLGRKYVKDGITSGRGMIFRFKIITATNTIIETVRTKRK